MSNDIYKLSLHEALYVERELSDPVCTSVMRVAGGWIYRSFDKHHQVMGMCFVPSNKEFVVRCKSDTKGEA